MNISASGAVARTGAAVVSADRARLISECLEQMRQILQQSSDHARGLPDAHTGDDPLISALHTVATHIVDTVFAPPSETPIHAVPFALCADLLAVRDISPRQVLSLILDLRPLLRALPQISCEADLQLDDLHLQFAAAYVDSRDRLHVQRLTALHREQHMMRRWLTQNTARPPENASGEPS